MKNLALFLFIMYVLPMQLSAQDSLSPSLFEEVNSFKLKTPNGFQSDLYLDNLAESSAKYFTLYDTLLSSKYVSNKNLKPGTLYEVIYYKIPPGASIEQCLLFLEEKDAILCGAGCLSLLVQYMPSKILEGWTMSLDKQERLFDYERYDIDVIRVGNMLIPTEGKLGVPWILWLKKAGQKEFLLFPGKVPDGLAIKMNQYMIAFIPYK